eukprot:5003659-Amphidinium_carterae.1
MTMCAPSSLKRRKEACYAGGGASEWPLQSLFLAICAPHIAPGIVKVARLSTDLQLSPYDAVSLALRVYVYSNVFTDQSPPYRGCARARPFSLLVSPASGVCMCSRIMMMGFERGSPQQARQYLDNVEGIGATLVSAEIVPCSCAPPVVLSIVKVAWLSSDFQLTGAPHLAPMMLSPSP